jgi:hypothetical protein
MSMKRTKQKQTPRFRDGSDASAGASHPTQREKTWEEQLQGQPDAAFQPYAMAATYAKGAFVQHAKFGRGVVLGVEGPRVVVLFQEGQKKLGHAPPAVAAGTVVPPPKPPQRPPETPDPQM